MKRCKKTSSLKIEIKITWIGLVIVDFNQIVKISKKFGQIIHSLIHCGTSYPPWLLIELLVIRKRRKIFCSKNMCPHAHVRTSKFFENLIEKFWITMEKINNACLLVKIMPRVNIICEIKLKNLIQFLSSFPHN